MWSQKNFKFSAFILKYQRFFSITRTIFSHSISDWTILVSNTVLILFDRSNCKLNEPFKTSWSGKMRKENLLEPITFQLVKNIFCDIFCDIFFRKRPVVKNVFLSNRSRKTSIYSQRSLFKIPQNTKLHTSLPLAAKVFLVKSCGGLLLKKNNMGFGLVW